MPAQSQRHALAGALLQRQLVGRDRPIEGRRAALPLAKIGKRNAEIILSRGPVVRAGVARGEIEGLLVDGDGLDERGLVSELVAKVQQCVALVEAVAPARLGGRRR